ncbi:4-phosphopantetheinyl transferase [Bifidobacterium primatium]|uniref:Holo-[acyl-carrier-protein] synthase n=1 Tax=Bifidobacterium primatium TaxID=2045438 RepID=A0A2M9H9V6_9BIFI|nr:4'-phosphopantetheinyl transferase superfamily protein [Bifidobacterium primatium]PJM73592.1 4-phosphopantetheinyl transferase [Bifidobacterium primatium]
MNADSIDLPRPSTVLGLGHDVVDIAAFAEQLAEPGSRMRALFSSRELRQAALRARVKHDDESAHLAVRWAGKEAVLKAWSEALESRPNPYTLDDFPWSGIEILDDSRGRPSVTLRADVDRTLHGSLADDSTALSSAPSLAARPVSSSAAQPVSSSYSRLAWHVSLSHDGPVASAVILLVRE